MLIKKADDLKSSEITDKEVYLNRRVFIRGAALAGGAVATGFVYRYFTGHAEEAAPGEKIADVQAPALTAPPINENLTSYKDITNYNNFYEFSTDKLEVAKEAKGFVTRPWTVAVEGLVQKPRVFDLDDLLKLSPPEERIYRHRCVERWSMVIPWVGFPLAKLLDEVQPLAQAKYVAFETLADQKQM
ncbi:MAG TPA: molybdopterin-dependent oxidoreductase, partial [Blastocatellia bacterium]|nr:molybdopterin-dependent oxidoreductase [Blastocatellia bacterium]